MGPWICLAEGQTINHYILLPQKKVETSPWLEWF